MQQIPFVALGPFIYETMERFEADALFCHKLVLSLFQEMGNLEFRNMLLV